ncbi:MAG TPA: helix-turn-helix transcriptional regulator [Pirellulales bacterium]|nr:helix-turn-helix transcriptional regulator [Pirellulales bacterium]
MPAPRAGTDKAAISRLENGVASNPTLLTLLSLANGLGKRVVVKLVDDPAAKRRRTG